MRSCLHFHEVRTDLALSVIDFKNSFNFHNSFSNFSELPGSSTKSRDSLPSGSASSKSSAAAAMKMPREGTPERVVPGKEKRYLPGDVRYKGGATSAPPPAMGKHSGLRSQA